MKMWMLYLGGAMLHQPDFGFPQFDKAEERLLALPNVRYVFNPARRDREAGFKPEGMKGTPEELAATGFSRREALAADMTWIGTDSQGMACLPTWPGSDGTKSEIMYHQGLHLPVWELDDFIFASEHGMDLSWFTFTLDISYRMAVPR